MTFDDILNYCADNSRVYNMLLKSLKSNRIIPFIGAGMSHPIYPTWLEILERLANSINSAETKRRILSEIPSSPQLAADQIAHVLGCNTVLDDMRDILQSEYIRDYSDIENMAVWLLPALFPQTPIITTNYEHLLEYVFEKNGEPLGLPITPSRRTRWTQARQRGLHYLFKIHGDIDDDTEEDVIFTASQYQQKYDPNGELVQELTEWFSGSVMLFLGCSLEKDNTLDILKKISSTKRVTHYAILPCAQGDKLDKRTRELSDLGIRAIFYPQGKHEAVRIILETLLYTLFPGKYQLLKSKKSALKNPAACFPFVHNSGVVDFVSRKDELEALHQFLDDDRGVLWWAITGAGGCGKTRLADQLESEVRASWDVFRVDGRSLSAQETQRLDGILKPQLYILDYIFPNERAVGQWIAKISQECYPCKIRFLMLDRPVLSERESFMDRLCESASPLVHREIEHKSYAPVYALQPLSPAALKEIMDNYIHHQTGKHPPKQTLNDLYNLLKQIDAELVRPLFALFIAEAAISNSHDVDSDQLLHWSQREVLDYIIKRELQLLDSTVQSMGNSFARSPKRIYQAVRTALAFASMTDGISIEEYFDTLFPEDGALIKQFCSHAYIDRNDFLEELRISDGQNLFPLKPDIIGEYLILCVLSQQADVSVKEFVGKAFWYPKRAAETIRRIISDFSFLDEGDFASVKNQFMNIELADGIQKIPSNAFRNCTFLKSVHCPESVTQIGARAFQNCIALTNVSLPNGLVTLPSKLFANCISLISLRLPAHLELIREEAFRNCRALIQLDEGLPESLTTIKRSAFRDCVCLRSINIPSRLTHLAPNIFNNCSSLEAVSWGADSCVTSIKQRAFASCTSLKTVSLPEAVTKIDRAAFEDCVSITDIRLPDQIGIIEEYSFKNCQNLRTIHFPNQLKEIQLCAFENCIRLQKISFNHAIDLINSYAFRGCTALEEADFSRGVNYIGRFAFADCVCLSFPNDQINALKRINSYAFRNCHSLKEIYLPGRLQEIAEGCFEGCTSLSAIFLPESTQNIGKYAFSGCSSLSHIQIPESVQHIFPAAFARSGIEEITLPASVREVKNSAFADCCKLKEVTIQNPDTSISKSAFCGCLIENIHGKRWQKRRIKNGTKKPYHEIPLTKRSHVGTDVLPPKRKPARRPDLELPVVLKPFDNSSKS